MEAESYADSTTASFINEAFIPVEAHIKEHPAWFKRFGAVWTPTIVVLDHAGSERYRIEGYLPVNWIRARLEMGRARVVFMRKDWTAAKEIYASVAEQHADTDVAAEAIYWRAVCEYKASNDHTVLTPAAKELSERYPGNEWTLKASPWDH